MLVSDEDLERGGYIAVCALEAGFLVASRVVGDFDVLFVRFGECAGECGVNVPRHFERGASDWRGDLDLFRSVDSADEVLL